MKTRISIVLLILLLVFPVLAQDTPTAEGLTATPEVTLVATVAPDAPPIVVVNNPPDNGFDSGMVKFILIVVGLTCAALVVVIIDQNRTVRAGLVQLGASTPAFVYEGGKSGVQAGIGSLETLAKSTDFTNLDDEAVAELKRRVLSWVKEIDAERAKAISNSVERFQVGR